MRYKAQAASSVVALRSRVLDMGTNGILDEIGLMETLGNLT